MRRLLCLIFCVFASLGAAAAGGGEVHVISLDDMIISPVTQQYIEGAIDRAEAAKAAALVIRLNTPGGMLESTRGIVLKILNARVPVVVYVAPSGARAGSAGVFITLAAHVAAMAPMTNIGAAHPVTIGGGDREGNRARRLIRRISGEDEGTTSPATRPGGLREVIEEERDPMSEKIINDTVAWIKAIARERGRNEKWAEKAVTESVSIPEGDALAEKVIDLIAVDLTDLLARIDGREVKLAGGAAKIRTAGATVAEFPMTTRQRFLGIIANPNIAYLLMMLGILGLVFEFTHPGVAFPGIAGLICLLLALYTFQVLPINWAALALVLLGLVLLVAEIKIVSHGLLAIGGIICLFLGSIMLFESPDPFLRVSLTVIVPVVVTLAAIVLFVVNRAVRSFLFPVATGSQGLIGEAGRAETDLDPEGKVAIHGELWNADALSPVRKGEPVRVVRIAGLHLTVEPDDTAPVSKIENERKP